MANYLSIDLLQLSRNPLRNYGGIESVASFIHSDCSSDLSSCLTLSLSLATQSHIKPLKNEFHFSAFEFCKFRLPSSFIFLKTFFALPKSIILLVHAPDPFLSLCALVHSLVFRSRLLVFWHSDYSTKSIFSPLFRLLNFLLLLASDRVLTTSPKLLQESSHLAFFKRKCFVLPLFHDNRSFSSPPSIHDRKYDCLIFGRLASYKNIGLAVESFLLSSASSLCICGSGPLLVSLQQYFSCANIPGKSVYFLPNPSPSEKYKVLSTSRLLLLASTSSSEAFAITQVEAFSVGTPVVSFDIPRSGVSWVNISGVSGLVAPVSSRDLSSSISTVLDNPDLLSRLSSGAYKRSMSFTSSRFRALFHYYLYPLTI